MDKTMYEDAIACLNNLIVRDLIKDPHGDHYTEIMDVLEEHNLRNVGRRFGCQVAYTTNENLLER